MKSKRTNKTNKAQNKAKKSTNCHDSLASNNE